MSDFGGYHDEMTHDCPLDEASEHMVTGRLDPTSPVGAVLDEIRGQVGTPPSPEAASAHLAAAVRESQLVKPDPASQLDRTRRHSQRRRRVFSFLTSSLLGKILAGSMAFAATTGTLAATGALPDPVQGVVADVVSVVGIDIPNPDDQAVVEEPTEAADTETESNDVEDPSEDPAVVDETVDPDEDDDSAVVSDDDEADDDDVSAVVSDDDEADDDDDSVVVSDDDEADDEDDEADDDDSAVVSDDDEADDEDSAVVSDDDEADDDDDSAAVLVDDESGDDAAVVSDDEQSDDDDDAVVVSDDDQSDDDSAGAVSADDEDDDEDDGESGGAPISGSVF